MLLPLFDWLSHTWQLEQALAGAEQMVTRALIASLVSLVLVVGCGPRWIAWLKRHCPEPIKTPSPELARLQQAKGATPTMGGLFVVGALVVSTVAIADWTSPYVPIVVASLVAFGAIGLCDDLIKLKTSACGLSARSKFIAQSVVAVAASSAVYQVHARLGIPTELRLPWVGTSLHLGWMLIPFWTVLVVGTSNAVNLTDGLDGLAGGCMIAATAALGLLAYVNVPQVAGADEMLVIAAATLGAVLGFLWFNCHPAMVFMGDTGALPLGGLLGLLAVIARQELLTLVVAGVFVVEVASVIVQVASFRLRGQRALLCAPLHHHFQLKGWSEKQIVARFWLAAALCAAVGIGSLKLGAGEATLPSQLAKRQTVTPSHAESPR